MKKFILLLILSGNIVLHASNIDEIACENGDAIACYELGEKIGRIDLRKDEKIVIFPNRSQVKSLYKKACQYGYAYGCRELDKKFGKNEIKLLKNKCDSKDAKSCEKLGLIFYTKSLGGLLTMVTNDKLLEKSENYYKKSCNYGSGSGCYYLAIVINERPFSKNHEKIDIEIVNYYEKACKFEYGMACSKLGELYSKGTYSHNIYTFKNIEINKTKANTYQKKACEYGSVKDCSYLAFKFKEDHTTVLGFSDDLTDPIARKYREKACEFGDALSCEKMANIYNDGLGVKQDYFKAVSYYKKACASNIQTSCTNLGVKYYNGQGVRQDYAKAQQYFKDACHKGELNACNNIGLMYFNGTGTQKDYFKAKFFFEKACNPAPQPPFNISTPIVNSCINLGQAYLRGLGVKQSLQKAKEYFGKACDNGLQLGCSEYAKLNRLKGSQ